MNLPMYRQGDVLLIQLSRQVPLYSHGIVDGDGLVLAHGEKTGHTHSVPAVDAVLCTTDAGSLLGVLRETQVTHPEHASITLSPGEYRVVIQRQYSPVGDMPVDD
jgi:hypothetical protein